MKRLFYISSKALSLVLTLTLLYVPASGDVFADNNDAKKIFRKSYNIYFRINRADVDSSYAGNAGTIRVMRRDIDSLLSTGKISPDSIHIVSSSSPDGNALYNMRLSERRGAGTAELVKALYPQFRPSSVVYSPVGEDWPKLRSLVHDDPGFPEREKLLELIDSGMDDDAKEKTLRKMGPTFRYLLDNCMFRLRYSAVTFNVSMPDISHLKLGQPDYVPDDRLNFIDTLTIRRLARGTGVTADAGKGGGGPARKRNLMLNVKTNLVSDLAAIPSLEIEIPVKERWSINLEGSVAWWSSYKKDFFYQFDMLSPEVRWWFGQKSRWHGHYLGVFGMVGLYDLEWMGRRGYQGEYWGTGISYGYMFPVAEKLSIETGIGLGYMMTGYEEYLPIDDHYVYQQTSRTRFVGPLKLKVGLVWRIGDKSGNGRKRN